MARRLTSLEFALAVVSSLLLLCCVGLITVSWISLKPEGPVAALSGRMAITGGAVFSATLRNSSSLEFRSLAFDVQNLLIAVWILIGQQVSEAFSCSELSRVFRSCRVLHFSQGSVVVTFDLWLNQLIDMKEVEKQLGAGLQEVDNTGLVVDRSSIQITEKDGTTATPTTDRPMTATPTTDRPVTATPTTDRPMTATPTTDRPVTATPTTDRPMTATPTTDRPVTATPTTNRPMTATPTTNRPMTATPTTNRPMTATPTTNRPMTATPTTNRPMTATPMPDRPMTATPTTDRPMTATPTTDRPMTATPTTDRPMTAMPTTDRPCPPHQKSCADGSACILTVRFCDGVPDCPDGSDEDASLCATSCDGQFVLRGLSGWFSSSVDQYDSSSSCRWIIRVDRGLSVQINFDRFETEENVDTLRLYEGVGADKHLTAELSGSAPPGTVWLLTDQSTVEFFSDDVTNLPGFNATYNAANTSDLTDEQKLSCSFEHGMCFWRQEVDDDGDWIRTRGSTFPPLSGPTGDHTLGNSSGFYVVTAMSPGQWLKSFRIHSLSLTPPTTPVCLSFWYHMFGEDVHRLSVLLLQTPPSPTVTVAFQRDGNYGDNWNYGQVTLNLTTESTVAFEALKLRGMRNDIALDDITLTSEPCGPAPPEPTNVPPIITTPPVPADCGGPFDLWEPNSSFSSPNYPHSYRNMAKCLWTLHTTEGRNIELHFLDFDVEATYDVVEVRDGVGPNSTLLAVLTGSHGPAHDLYSTTNQVSVWFFTDKSGYGRGFRANFTSGVDLGSPAPCAGGHFLCQTGSCIHGNSVCDGVVDCPDGSDEASCVSFNASSRLQIRIVSSLLSVCADTWNPHLSVFTCQYLGYRSGEATLLPALPQDSPFAIVTVSSNRTLETSVRETCSTNKVVSLDCDNQPCGVRPIRNNTEDTDQSADMTSGQGVVRVVGGVDAEKGAWPWMVSLHWRGQHVCGASLIGRDWLLTAAHCVYGKNVHLDWWSAVFGLHAQSNFTSVETRRVDRIVFNSEYNRQTKQADIAMMHLQQPISLSESVQPACLPPEEHNFPAGTTCFIAGWGRDEAGYLPDVLQEAQVPVLVQDQCQLWLPEYTITSSMLCAGYADGGVDSCQGDSGGPLMCEDGGRWTVIGVTSFGVGCGHPHRPGVYARVSTFSTWIAQTRRSWS